MILPTDRQMFNHFQERRTPSHRPITWEDKHHNSEHSPLSPSSPSFHCWAQWPMVWHNDLWSIGVSCPICVPSSLLVHSSLLTGRVGWKAEKALALCKHCSATTQTLVCYQHCFHQIS